MVNPRTGETKKRSRTKVARTMAVMPGPVPPYQVLITTAAKKSGVGKTVGLSDCVIRRAEATVMMARPYPKRADRIGFLRGAAAAMDDSDMNPVGSECRLSNSVSVGGC